MQVKKDLQAQHYKKQNTQSQLEQKLHWECGTVFAWTDNFWLVKIWTLQMDFMCCSDVPHSDLQLILYCDTIPDCTAPQAHNI